MKIQPLREYIDSVGISHAAVNLKKPETTLRTRVRSCRKGQSWLVIEIGGVKRCALVDDAKQDLRWYNR